MFPWVGSQIIIEPGSPEDFHVMEVKNVSRDRWNVTSLVAIASREFREFQRSISEILSEIRNPKAERNPKSEIRSQKRI